MEVSGRLYANALGVCVGRRGKLAKFEVIDKFCNDQEISKAIQLVILAPLKILSLGYGFGSGSTGMSVVYGGFCCFIGVSRHKVHEEI